MADVTNHLANLVIDDKEDDALQVEAEALPPPVSFLHCFVGLFLTSSVIHFESMRNTLANVWKPLGGVSITDLGEGRFLFRLFHPVDVDRIDNGSPWFFNSHLLILHRLQEGEDPMCTPLHLAKLWVQVLDLPFGFMSEEIAKSLGNFVGQFLEYDTKLSPSSHSRIM
ncbi:hypothetical protein HRI_003749500 [Hibiscus trionum]|uniref:DUF4283 domain-containing protein n=1 Tax=Hibiscus trionum TaxID=183268 RepID=A0A9W7MEC9_HIBTR|nr:hypothetical protein HRI_003749500 [Hibiscus trionum]